ncbi:hypothetical protein ACFSKL_05670 [Belliella marina]|uniref:DUF4221 domain-containing protein n=1 Tax=Belliella marina TaxID=1644146 RepID=A0ABW4VJW7_9BACT
MVIKYQIYLLGLIYLTGCSGNSKLPEHFEFIKVSKQKSLSFAQKNLSAYNLFPSSAVYPGSDSILVYNVYHHTLDMIQFKNNTAEVLHGFTLADDGPEAVKIPKSIILTNGHVILPQIHNISVLDNKGKTLKNFSLLKNPAFKNMSNPVFTGTHSHEMGNFNNQYNNESFTYYFYVKDLLSSYSGLFGLDILNDTIVKLPDIFDKNLLDQHEIKYSDGKVTMMKDDFPFILYHDNKIFISYFASSQIDYYDLDSEKSFNISIETYNFESQKSKPKPIPPEKKFSEAMGFNEEWDNEVAFGRLEVLPSEKGYYRFIKGPSVGGAKEFDVFLEIYDIGLTKKSEINLSNLNSDLGLLHFPISSSIVVKAKSQMSDDEFLYYEIMIQDSFFDME